MTRNTAVIAGQEAHSRYFDLGQFHRRVSTSNPQCQVWFDRGLIWCYGFNRPEAVACFKKAIAADPDCAMSYWGLAYSSGPYYNQSWKHYQDKELRSTLRQTYQAVQDAKSRAHKAKPFEQALIHALGFRHPSYQPPEDFSAWDRSYADAMENVYRRFGHNVDAVALYADALMVLTPWALWDPWTGKPAANARTLDAKAVIEHGLTLEHGFDHPGLLHLYIHLMEMSREPEVVLKATDRLRSLIPDAGHLLHMPSHIDVLVGDYRRAMEANIAAVRADDLYVELVGPFTSYTLYRAHDYHSLVYAATLAGRLSESLKYSLRLEDALPERFMRKGSNADWTESFHAVRPHVLVRFGQWDEVLNLRLPNDRDLYCFTTATYHYAKGIAWAAKGQISRAEDEKSHFRSAASKVPASRFDFPNRCIDILPVADSMLEGEIAYRKGDFEVAFRHLRKAVELDDGLGYSEPWSWMMPTRHALGALLMEQGRYEEAAPVYEADLGLDTSLPRGHQHPNNVWALVGYHECLTRLGRTREARLLDLPLRSARELADVDIKSSCFCKRDLVAASSAQEGQPAAGECCSTGDRLQILNKL